MSFRVGQAVMCIKDDDLPPKAVVAGAPLEEGKVYTVRAYNDQARHAITEQPMKPVVRIVENTVHFPPWPAEQWWNAERFRALDDAGVHESATEQISLTMGAKA